MEGDPARINSLEANFRKVTPELIQKTATEYLRKTNRTVLVLEAGKAAHRQVAKEPANEIYIPLCHRNSCRGSAVSGSPQETPPPGSAPKPFQLAATNDFTLPNGMRVTLVPYGSVPKVALSAYVDAGGARETADKVWLARLTALLLKEGTAKRSAAQIASEAADMGSQLEIEARKDPSWRAASCSPTIVRSSPRFWRTSLQTPACPLPSWLGSKPILHAS